MARIAHSAVLQIRHAPAPMITVVCPVTGTATVNATYVLITRPVPVDMNISTVIPGMDIIKLALYVTLAPVLFIARPEPPTRPAFARRDIIVMAMAIARYVQQDIFVRWLNLRLIIYTIIAHLDTIAPATVAANAPTTLCVPVEFWTK